MRENPSHDGARSARFFPGIRAGETIGWAEATAAPVFLTRMLDAQAERCPSFRVFFALTFSDALAAGPSHYRGSGRLFRTTWSGPASMTPERSVSACDIPGRSVLLDNPGADRYRHRLDRMCAAARA